jgi:hypothetical protein
MAAPPAITTSKVSAMRRPYAAPWAGGIRPEAALPPGAVGFNPGCNIDRLFP